MTVLLTILGNLLRGLAALAPTILAFLAGDRAARLENSRRTLEKRHAQLRLRPPSDRAVAGRLRDGTF